MTETPGNYNVGAHPDRLQLSIQHPDSLIEQVTRLTEVLTTGLNDFNNRFARMTEATEQQATVGEHQALTIERQSLALDRLALMLERVLPRDG